MMVSVTLSPGGRHDLEPEVALASPSAQPEGGLRHESLLGAGVRLVVDTTAPDHWRAIRVASLDSAAEPVMRALIGDDAVERVTGRLRELRSGAVQSLSLATVGQMEVDSSKADPWLRIAATDALDRWLQLPLDQSLIDAERGIARSRAAMTLPQGEGRQDVIADALELARRASRGLAGYLNGLSPLKRPPPLALLNGLKQLVEGYDNLIGEVKGTDRELRRVVTRGTRLIDGDSAPSGASTSSPPSHYDLAPPYGLGGVSYPDHPPDVSDDVRNSRKAPDAAHRLVNLIDPRQIRARVCAVTADPAVSEVSLVEATGPGPSAVLVNVPAYGPVPADSRLTARVLVRLVDRSSGEPLSEALLTLSAARGGAHAPEAARLIYSGAVALQGAVLADLRADVFDALSEVPPAAADNDAALQNVRRAMLSLQELRRLIADSRMQSVAGRRIRLGKSEQAGALVSTTGPGDLLVAELAAAHRAMDG